MKTILLGGAAVLALGGCAAQTGAPVAVTDVAPPAASAPVESAAVPVPNNILLADWTGPYQGVPPWDQVKPELFDEAYTFAIAELEREAA
ncbi:MAG: hypothetical protein LH610_02720, partial [Sphingomonas bacterium]|nr:hypothetical protein [Sphingomonas bacterium]